MARLDKYLELNDKVNSIINHTLEELEEDERIQDNEIEASMWEKMWDDIEQTERYYNNRYW